MPKSINEAVMTKPVQNEAKVVEPAKEYLSEQDRHAFDMVKMNLALVKTQHELAEASYTNAVLKLTLKYTLTEKDVINEQGEILRGAKN